MDLSPLDNPVWHALNSHHHHLAIRGEIAVRYQPGIFAATAMPEYGSAGFDDLGSLVEANEIIGVMGLLPEDISGWEVLQIDHVRQLVSEDLKPATPVDAVVLAAEDVPEMLDLVHLTQPGPFLPRTIGMGQYLGVRQDGQLVAMAGERLRAANLMTSGIKPLDALHLALAETGNADYFCTCDDKLLQHSKQIKDLTMKVINPVDLVQEIEK